MKHSTQHKSKTYMKPAQGPLAFFSAVTKQDIEDKARTEFRPSFHFISFISLIPKIHGW
jgi:hypothetical protein